MEIRAIQEGFVGFGEINTPRELIDNRCADAAELLKKQGVELTYANPVSDDPDGADAKRAIAELSGKEYDLLVVCIAGWIPAWAVFSVIEKFKHIPILLWGLTGWQEGDRFVTTADQAGTTGLRKPMQEMGYNFKYIVNYRGEAARIDEIMNFAKAARTVKLLKESKIGMAGYRDMRLYGTLYDGVSLKGKIGPEIEHFDLLELTQMMEKLDQNETEELIKYVNESWDFVKAPLEGTVENSVKLFQVLKAKINDRGYDAFSFVDVDGIKKLMHFAPAGSMTLLHDKMDIPTVPENDSMGAVTQLIVKFLTGQIAAYLEIYEFMENGAMMGVPDYVPREIVEGKVTVMPNAFGEFGEGLLNVSKLKEGALTLARLSYSGDEYTMHIVNATAKQPISWEEAGWAPPAPQLPSLDVCFDFPSEEFIQKVMGQHYIISYGDNRSVLEEFCKLLGIRVI